MTTNSNENRIEEMLEFHEDFGTFLRKEGYTAEYTKTKCRDFAEIILKENKALLSSIVEALEKEKEKYGIENNNTICEEGLEIGLDTAIEVVQSFTSKEK